MCHQNCSTTAQAWYTIFILNFWYFSIAFLQKKWFCCVQSTSAESWAVSCEICSILPTTRCIQEDWSCSETVIWVILKTILLKYSRHCRLDEDNYMVVYSSKWFDCFLNGFSFLRYFWLFTMFCNKWFDMVLYTMEFSLLLIHVFINVALSFVENQKIRFERTGSVGLDRFRLIMLSPSLWLASTWNSKVEIADTVSFRSQSSFSFSGNNCL